MGGGSPGAFPPVDASVVPEPWIMTPKLPFPSFNPPSEAAIKGASLVKCWRKVSVSAHSGLPISCCCHAGSVGINSVNDVNDRAISTRRAVHVEVSPVMEAEKESMLMDCCVLVPLCEECGPSRSSGNIIGNRVNVNWEAIKIGRKG